MKLFYIAFLIPFLSFAKPTDNLKIKTSENSVFKIYPSKNRFNIDKYSDSISFSPDKKLIMVQKTEINYFISESGKEIKNENGFCDIIKSFNGCVIGTYNGEICTANWKGNTNLLLSNGSFSVPQKTEQLRPQDLLQDLDYQNLDFTIQSYMACYPIDKSNASYYKGISKKIADMYNRKDEALFIEKNLLSF